MRNPIVYFFDFLKKRSMEQHYLLPRVWGRNEANPDIQAALSLIDGRRFHRCLDLGTGLGHFADALSPLCDDVLAVDISERAITRARERLPHLKNVEWRVSNIRTLQLEEKFDLIVLGDVLYYLGDVRFPSAFRELVRDISNMTTPTGNILITTFVTRGRTKEQAYSYGEIFTSCGMRVEHSETFTAGEKTWVMQLLSR